MSTIEYSTDVGTTSSHRAGPYFAVLQLVFTLSWTVYLIYLPKLVAEVGIGSSAAILLLDQAIFTVTDTAMGIAADRIGRVVGRISIFACTLTALSCTAFVALPFVSNIGPGAKVWFIALIVIWTATSSALRAPPLTLLGRCSKPSIPLLASLAMFGYGLAGAVSPYLGVILSDYDARLPFVISSAVLLLTTLALSPIEGSLARESRTRDKSREIAKPFGAASIILVVSMVLLALGYQLHFNVKSVPLFLRFIKPGNIEWYLSVFWIGFNLVLFPASFFVRRHGGLIVMSIAGLLGATVLIGAEYAGSLNTLTSAQFLAGAAWGCMMISAVSAALEIGQGGVQGKMLGLIFSALAVATFVRIAVVLGGLPKLPQYASLLSWTPVACWLAGGAGLLAVVVFRARQGVSNVHGIQDLEVLGRE